MEQYTKWITMHYNKLLTVDWDNIIYCGHGYVLMVDGTRIDFITDENDIHKFQREHYNNNTIENG